MAVLRIQVLSGPHADVVAGRLREHDRTGMLAVAVGDQPATAALVVGTGAGGGAERSADVLLDDGQSLVAQADRLWAERLAPFAHRMAGVGRAKPVVLHGAVPRLAAGQPGGLPCLRADETAVLVATLGPTGRRCGGRPQARWLSPRATPGCRG